MVMIYWQRSYVGAYQRHVGYSSRVEAYLSFRGLRPSSTAVRGRTKPATSILFVSIQEKPGPLPACRKIPRAVRSHRKSEGAGPSNQGYFAWIHCVSGLHRSVEQRLEWLVWNIKIRLQCGVYTLVNGIFDKVNRCYRRLNRLSNHAISHKFLDPVYPRTIAIERESGTVRPKTLSIQFRETS